MVGPNAVRLRLPEHLKVHPVVHVSMTTLHRRAPPHLTPDVPPHPEPVGELDGEPLYAVQEIMAHKRAGRGYRFLTRYSGQQQSDAGWEPTSMFVDSDKSINDVFRAYIRTHNILQKYHNYGEPGEMD